MSQYHHRHSAHIRKVHLARYLVTAGVLLLGMFSVVHMVDNYSQQVLPYATEMSSDNLLQATNSERSKNGAGVLYNNAKLSQAAQLKANDMAARNYWSHDTPDGEPPWVFIGQAGYTYVKAGENLAYGFSTSRSAVNGWMNSPKHRENMLDPVFTEVGFGFVNSPSYQKGGKQTIVVAMYGTPALANASATSPEQAPTATGATIQGTSSPMEDPALRFTPNGPAVPIGGAASFNTLDQPEAKPVSRLQSWLGESVTVSTTALIVVLGILVSAYITKHMYAVRRIIIHGESHIMHHPLLDIGLLGMIALAIIVSRTAGFIQ